MYYVIYCDSSGETSIRKMNHDMLQEYLEDVEEKQVLKELPITTQAGEYYKWSEPSKWDEGTVLIIKGEIAKLIPVSIVKEWRIE